MRRISLSIWLLPACGAKTKASGSMGTVGDSTVLFGRLSLFGRSKTISKHATSRISETEITNSTGRFLVRSSIACSPVFIFLGSVTLKTDGRMHCGRRILDRAENSSAAKGVSTFPPKHRRCRGANSSVIDRAGPADHDY